MLVTVGRGWTQSNEKVHKNAKSAKETIILLYICVHFIQYGRYTVLFFCTWRPQCSCFQNFLEGQRNTSWNFCVCEVAGRLLPSLQAVKHRFSRLLFWNNTIKISDKIVRGNKKINSLLNVINGYRSSLLRCYINPLVRNRLPKKKVPFHQWLL